MTSKQPDDWSRRQWPFSSCLTTADFWFFSEAYMVPLLYSCRFIEMQDGLPGVVLIKYKWSEQLLTVIRKMESVFYIWRLVQICLRPLLPTHMHDKWPWSIITIQETISQVCILIYMLHLYSCTRHKQWQMHSELPLPEKSESWTMCSISEINFHNSWISSTCKTNRQTW